MPYLTSVELNQKKYNELNDTAILLGKLRKEVWQRFGSLAWVGANHRKIRDEWVQSRDFSPLPAKAWKETLRDVLDDIQMYEEAANAVITLCKKSLLKLIELVACRRVVDCENFRLHGVFQAFLTERLWKVLLQYLNRK